MQNDQTVTLSVGSTIDANSPDSSYKVQIDKQGRRYDLCNGAQYFLGEPKATRPLKDPRLAEIAPPPREMSFLSRALLFLSATKCLDFGMLFFVVLFGFWYFTLFTTSAKLYTTIPFLILVAVYVSRMLKKLRFARRLLRLLINGEPAFGVFDDIRDTGRRVGEYEHIVYEVAFHFCANDGLYYETTMETTNLCGWLDARTRSQTRLVFYDSKNPKDAVLLDAISRGIKFENGRRFVASLHSTTR